VRISLDSIKKSNLLKRCVLGSCQNEYPFPRNLVRASTSLRSPVPLQKLSRSLRTKMIQTKIHKPHPYNSLWSSTNRTQQMPENRTFTYLKNHKVSGVSSIFGKITPTIFKKSNILSFLNLHKYSF
jgi:hypothetical protein